MHGECGLLVSEGISSWFTAFNIEDTYPLLFERYVCLQHLNRQYLLQVG